MSITIPASVNAAARNYPNSPVIVLLLQCYCLPRSQLNTKPEQAVVTTNINSSAASEAIGHGFRWVNQEAGKCYSGTGISHAAYHSYAELVEKPAPFCRAYRHWGALRLADTPNLLIGIYRVWKTLSSG